MDIRLTLKIFYSHSGNKMLSIIQKMGTHQGQLEKEINKQGSGGNGSQPPKKPNLQPVFFIPQSNKKEDLLKEWVNKAREYINLEGKDGMQQWINPLAEKIGHYIEEQFPDVKTILETPNAIDELIKAISSKDNSSTTFYLLEALRAISSLNEVLAALPSRQLNDFRTLVQQKREGEVPECVRHLDETTIQNQISAFQHAITQLRQIINSMRLFEEQLASSSLIQLKK
jgi:hypothetical protein